jgi:hypothetical protein
MTQLSPEPVAWIIQTEKFGVISDPYAVIGRYKDVLDCCDKGDPIPLYTHPAGCKIVNPGNKT